MPAPTTPPPIEAAPETPPPPIEAAPTSDTGTAYDAERARIGGTVFMWQGGSSQTADGASLALGGAGYASPIFGFWGASADATFWASDFDFGHLGFDGHVAGRMEPFHVRDRYDLAFPGDLSVGAVVRRGPGPVSVGFGLGLRVATGAVMQYTDATLAEAAPKLFLAGGARMSGDLWWEPVGGKLDGLTARADVALTVGTALGAHVGLTVDKPVASLPVELRGGLAMDLDRLHRIGRDPANVSYAAVVVSVGVARVF